MAVSQTVATSKLSDIIEKGRAVAIGGIEAMRDEFRMRRDFAVNPASEQTVEVEAAA